MKLEKAIEILELNIKSVGKDMPTDTLTAVRLGVQALERIQYQRTMTAPINQPFLKDETWD